jgi:hypothetical protein
MLRSSPAFVALPSALLTGFGASPSPRSRRCPRELDVEDVGELYFEVQSAGCTVSLRIRIFMSDADAPDRYISTTPTLAARIRRANGSLRRGAAHLSSPVLPWPRRHELPEPSGAHRARSHRSVVASRFAGLARPALSHSRQSRIRIRHTRRKQHFAGNRERATQIEMTQPTVLVCYRRSASWTL